MRVRPCLPSSMPLGSCRQGCCSISGRKAGVGLPAGSKQNCCVESRRVSSFIRWMAQGFRVNSPGLAPMAAWQAYCLGRAQPDTQISRERRLVPSTSGRSGRCHISAHDLLGKSVRRSLAADSGAAGPKLIAAALKHLHSLQSVAVTGSLEMPIFDCFW